MNTQNKELVCLYKVDEILSNNENSIDEILMELITSIPAGWRYSKDCEVKLEWNDKVYKTEGYKNSPFENGV